MAQRIVTLCDAHQNYSDEDVPAAVWEISLLAPGASKPTTWSVDLCEDHGEELADLAKMLGTVGRVLDGPRGAKRASVARESTPGPGRALTAPDAVSCPVDGCDYTGKTRTYVNSHLRGRHDTSWAKVMGEPEPYACPEPGCGFTTSRPQGLGAHRRASHDVPA